MGESLINRASGRASLARELLSCLARLHVL